MRMNIRKAVAIAAVVVTALVLSALLNREAKGIYRTETVLPKLGAAPVYEELKPKESKEYTYISDRDMHIKSLKLFFVNTEAAGGVADTYIDIRVTDMLSSQSEPLYQGRLDMAEAVSGEWTDVPAVFDIHTKGIYEFVFTAYGCNPYFMHVDGYAMDISMGFAYEDDTPVRYSDVFYYSIPLILAATAASILFILFGYERVGKAVRRVFIPEVGSRLNEIYPDIFSGIILLIILGAIGLKVIKTAYIDGIYITADSDGYLREAVNLAAGNGFSYEGLAGYTSHFANWPILYPLMISGIMLISGVNAYLASKIVAIVSIGLIFALLFIEYRRDAWIYALAFTNAGFLAMAYNTWSEIPFVLFMLLFACFMGRLFKDEKPSIWVYAGVGASALLTFLTRYFGIYLWIVAAIYWLGMLAGYVRDRSAAILRKLCGLFITMALSGLTAACYLIMNKLRNGNPTGVSRGTWWDDYATLTDDLIHSLITEIFNIFSVEAPEYIAGLDTHLQVWIILLSTVIVALMIHNCANRIRKHEVAHRDVYTAASGILIVMAVVYYAVFIVVRYRSSMDTFYFRFFAPATVMLITGLIGMLLRAYRTASASSEGVYHVLAAGVTLVAAVCLLGSIEDAGRWRNERSYYDIMTESWDTAYSEIPYRSVILWNPMDYRSSWYRPDVYSGQLYADDTIDSLRSEYSASEYICMLKTDAEIVVSDGTYDPGLTGILGEAISASSPDARYIVIPR